jgi:2-keto-4-pentenoate hydratase
MSQTSQAIAASFRSARREATALTAFPGEMPSTLDAAYAIQEFAIAQWPDQIGGWKVGRILSPWLEQYGEDRLVGPIFTRSIHAVRPGETAELPVFTGGFAAVEAEFIVRLVDDAPADKLAWTPEEAASLVSMMHIGIEPAGSPLATINDLGPAVVISDFGNNAGLILGPSIPEWRNRPLEMLTAETFIEGRSVGRGSAASLPGGPLAALAFALSRNARRGRPLKARDLISTGATTGIHPIQAGQSARVDFGACGQIRCRAVPAKS